MPRSARRGSREMSLQTSAGILWGLITLASESEWQAMPEAVCRYRHTRDTSPERELSGQEEAERFWVLQSNPDRHSSDKHLPREGCPTKSPCIRFDGKDCSL
jgi:hypothetical protein